MSADTASPDLRDRFKQGLEAPICLTWEVTYGCNLACAHCLSSSGKRDPRELSTDECRRLIDELARMRVFYVNVGGGEPLVRRDFLTSSTTRWSARSASSSLDQRRADHAGGGGADRGDRLPRRADLDRRRDA